MDDQLKGNAIRYAKPRRRWFSDGIMIADHIAEQADSVLSAMFDRDFVEIIYKSVTVNLNTSHDDNICLFVSLVAISGEFKNQPLLDSFEQALTIIFPKCTVEWNIVHDSNFTL